VPVSQANKCGRRSDSFDRFAETGGDHRPAAKYGELNCLWAILPRTAKTELQLCRATETVTFIVPFVWNPDQSIYQLKKNIN